MSKRVAHYALALTVAITLIGGLADAQVINEMQVSTTSNDWEFIEIYHTPTTSLAGLTVVGVESDDGTSAGTVDFAFTISGSTNANGHYFASNSYCDATYGVTGDEALPSTLENSTAAYFLVTGWTGSTGDDLDTDNDGVLDVTPWASVLDSLTITDGGTGDHDYTGTVLGPDGTYLPSGVFRALDAGPWSATFLSFNTPDGTPGTSNPIPVELMAFSVE